MSEPIAIVGVGCRFPCAEGPDAFWQMLREGLDGISEIPPERWNIDDFYDADAQAPGKMNSRWSGLLSQVDQFDARFFGISPREAVHLDPQQRLLLEVAWEALEDAGQVPERLSGSRAGVFIGIMSNDYGMNVMGDPERVDPYTVPGTAYCIAANRLSYFFGFTGPSMAIDTACSSSLVAVHLACQSLRSGETTLALAGGVNVILAPEGSIWFTKVGLMSPDGRCKVFDAKANGLVRGEGAGVVVLKTLSRALADGDPIYALIKGGAVNQGGRTNGLMAPSRWAQEAVLREAYREAGVSPTEVQYVETHSTGTAFGDPIEAAALGTVRATARTPAGEPCLIGSVKTNIGHLEAASGIAGLIKVALMLKRREIPPNLHFSEPNPHINLEELGLQVPRSLMRWPRINAPLRAGVSAFGFGGTNAHLVLEEVTATDGHEEAQTGERAYFLPLSARNPEALQATARAHRELLARAEVLPVEALHDLCYTAGARRGHHDYRLGVTGRSREELIEGLDGFIRGETRPGISTGRKISSRRVKVVFAFADEAVVEREGVRGLLEQSPAFHETLKQCDAVFRPDAGGPSVLEELRATEALRHSRPPALTGSALFSLQVALAAVWRSWGVEPDAVVGAGAGEVAAAHVAGALSLEDAARVIFQRSRLREHELKGSNRSHDGWARELEGIEARRASTAPIYSTMTGTMIDGRSLDAAYWERQLDAPCLLDAALEALMKERHLVFVVPGSSSSSSAGLEEQISKCFSSHERQATVLPSLRPEEDGRAVMLDSLGALYSAGCQLNWNGLYPAGGRCASLPSYPWQRERFWSENREFKASAGRGGEQGARNHGTGRHELRGRHFQLAHQPDTHVWECELEARNLASLDGAGEGTDSSLPESGFAEIARAAVAAGFGAGSFVEAELDVQESLPLGESPARRVQVIYTLPVDGQLPFRIYSYGPSSSGAASEVWKLHATGILRAAQTTDALDLSRPHEGSGQASLLDWRQQALAMKAEDRHLFTENYLREEVAQVLGLTPSRLDTQTPLNALGIDSLMAMELRNRIEKSAGVVLPVVNLLRGPSVSEVAAYLLESLTQQRGELPAQGRDGDDGGNWQAGDAAHAIRSVEGEAGSLYPLSHNQKSLWFMQQLAPESPAYNLMMAWRVRSEVDTQALGRACQKLVDRHASLRTTYTVDSDGTPLQQVHTVQPVCFETSDASRWNDAELNARVAERAHLPFDLQRGPLVRVELFTRSAREHVLLIAVHHIVVDFGSMAMLMDELFMLYRGEASGVAVDLPAPGAQYTDYVRWQNGLLAGPEGASLRAYWQKKLAGKLPVLNLPTDRPRSSPRSLSGDMHVFKFDEMLTAQLKELARAEGVTLYTLLLAGYQLLLRNYTGQEDLIVGSPASGRSRADFERTVGYFANPIVFRADFSGNPTFKNFLQQVRQTVLGALAHQDYPFPLLVEALQIQRDPSRSPLCEAVFILQRPRRLEASHAEPQAMTPLEVFLLAEPGKSFEIEGLRLEHFELEQRVARFDLVLFLIETSGLLSGLLQYNKDLFDQPTIARLAVNFENLLRSIVAQPGARLNKLEMRTAAEEEKQMMESRGLNESKLRKLKNARRRAVDLSEVNLVKTDFLRAGETLPLVLTPGVEHLDAIAWAHDNREFVDAHLLKYGAILFRDFNLTSATEFERLAESLCGELFNEYADLPREEISGKIYGSTPYPSDQHILFHNESSHMPSWPLKIWFFCATAAQTGGETPVADCRRVYQEMDARLRERFERKGLMYVRNFIEGFDVSWQDFFRTKERSVVEVYCRNISMEVEWTEGNNLRISKRCPAVALHPRTGDKVFFNQIQAHHVSCLAPGVRQSMLELFGEENLPRNVYYGDGSIIEDNVLDAVQEVYQRVAVAFPWQEGDVLMLDNMLTAHGRNPYTGPRKIFVTMGEMISSQALSAMPLQSGTRPTHSLQGQER